MAVYVPNVLWLPPGYEDYTQNKDSLWHLDELSGITCLDCKAVPPSTYFNGVYRDGGYGPPPPGSKHWTLGEPGINASDHKSVKFWSVGIYPSSQLGFMAVTGPFGSAGWGRDLDLKYNSDYTFEVWYKLDPNAGGDLGHGYHTRALWSYTWQLVDQHDSFSCQINDTSNPTLSLLGDFLKTNGSFSLPYNTLYNVWHHIVAVGDEANHLVEVYFDGQLLGTTLKAISSPSYRASVLWLGARNAGVYGPMYSTGGWLDEFAVYGEKLTSDQILAHYASGIIGL